MSVRAQLSFSRLTLWIAELAGNRTLMEPFPSAGYCTNGSVHKFTVPKLGRVEPRGRERKAGRVCTDVCRCGDPSRLLRSLRKFESEGQAGELRSQWVCK